MLADARKLKGDPLKVAPTAGNACYGVTCKRYHETISLRMNAAQRKTLQAIFEKPTRAHVGWSKVEGLVRGLGARFRRVEDPGSVSGSGIEWRPSTGLIRAELLGRLRWRM